MKKRKTVKQLVADFKLSPHLKNGIECKSFNAITREQAERILEDMRKEFREVYYNDGTNKQS